MLKSIKILSKNSFGQTQDGGENEQASVLSNTMLKKQTKKIYKMKIQGRNWSVKRRVCEKFCRFVSEHQSEFLMIWKCLLFFENCYSKRQMSSHTINVDLNAKQISFLSRLIFVSKNLNLKASKQIVFSLSLCLNALSRKPRNKTLFCHL